MPRGTSWVVLLAFGCAPSAQPIAPPVCTPGEIAACGCDAALLGGQRCRDDGSGFEECICGDGGAELGGGPSVRASGGSPSPSGGSGVAGGSGGTGDTTGGTSSGGSGPCAGTVVPVQVPPVNAIFILDRSSTMASGTSPTRWEILLQGFTSFFQNVKSPAMFASVAFFPAPCDLDLDAGGGCVCSANEYNPAAGSANPMLTLVQIVGHTTVFGSLFDDTAPLGGTPTIAALQGSYTYAASAQAKVAGSVTYVVLLTDGPPGLAVTAEDGGIIGIEGCTGNNFATSETRAQTYAAQGIKTYVFGMGSIANLDRVATAGGTALVTIADASQLLSSLNALPKPVFSCTEPLPPTTGGDPSMVNVFFTNGSSSERQLISNNPSCGRGDGSGWYRSGNDVVLCAPTCNQLKQDPTTTLSAQFGCPPIMVP